MDNSTRDAKSIYDIMSRIQGDAKPVQTETKEKSALDTDIYDMDADNDNHILGADDPKTFYKSRKVDISDNRRPVYGVLTEPLRGDLKNKFDASTSASLSATSDNSYIPKA